jgi:hypothetical protein
MNVIEKINTISEVMSDLINFVQTDKEVASIKNMPSLGLLFIIATRRYEKNKKTRGISSTNLLYDGLLGNSLE